MASFEVGLLFSFVSVTIWDTTRRASFCRHMQLPPETKSCKYTYSIRNRSIRNCLFTATLAQLVVKLTSESSIQEGRTDGYAPSPRLLLLSIQVI